MYAKSITTLDEIVSSDYPIIFQDSLGPLFLFVGPTHDKVFEIFTPSNDSFEEDVRNFMRRQDFITVSTNLEVSNPLYKGRFDSLEVFCYHPVFLVRRDHYAYAQLNERITRLFETGLIFKWLSDVQYNYYYKGETDFALKDVVKKPESLNVHNIVVAFIVLGIGYVVSLFVLVCEILARYYSRR